MSRQQSGRRNFRRYDPLAVLVYVARYSKQHPGRSPSQRQIQRGLGISAPSVVHNMLHRLADRGLLVITTYGPGRAADFTVTDAGQAAVQTWQAERTADDTAATPA